MHTALDQNFITAYHVKKSTFCYYSRITIRVTPVKHAGPKKRTVPKEKKCKSERHEWLFTWTWIFYFSQFRQKFSR